jgi:hypothetical protein
MKAEPRGMMFRFDVPKGHKKDRAFSLGLAVLAAQEVLEEGRIHASGTILAEGFWV